MADQSMNGEDFSQDVSNGGDQQLNGEEQQQQQNGSQLQPAKDDDR